MPKVVDVDERRSELAAAAARVIARAGIEGASMREVAAEAGWTTGTLVHYFANKRQLLAFTLAVSLEERSARQHDRAGDDPLDALRAKLLTALPLDEASRLHWIVTLAFSSYAVTDDELATTQRDAYRDFRHGLIRQIEAVDPTIGVDQATTEAERLIALVDGVALQAVFDAASWPPERQIAVLDAGLNTMRTSRR